MHARQMCFASLAACIIKVSALYNSTKLQRDNRDVVCESFLCSPVSACIRNVRNYADFSPELQSKVHLCLIALEMNLPQGSHPQATYAVSQTHHRQTIMYVRLLS